MCQGQAIQYLYHLSKKHPIIQGKSGISKGARGTRFLNQLFSDEVIIVLYSIKKRKKSVEKTEKLSMSQS